MNEKLMDRARLDGDLAIVTRDRLSCAIDFNAHQARFNAKVLRLELVKMEKRTFWSARAVEKLAQVGGNWAREVVFVSLAEEEASSWRGLEELGCQQPAKTVERQQEFSWTYFVGGRS